MFIYLKREVPTELKEKADKFKNEGNDLMKAEKFKEALECYNKAIDIDKNNSVYYCNRAAAHSKLNDFKSSIEDCKNALKIDPSYSKAWGRLGYLKCFKLGANLVWLIARFKYKNDCFRMF